MAMHRPRVKCPYENCDAYVRSTSLAGHIQGVHKKVKSICQSCGKELSKQNYRQHYLKCASGQLKVRLSEKVYKRCSHIKTCHKKFRTALELATHIEKSHNNLEFCGNCENLIGALEYKEHFKDCEPKSTNVSGLNPLQTVSGGKDNGESRPCEICRRHVSSLNYEQHLAKCSKTVKNKLPKRCSHINCGLSFETARQLCEHVGKVHNGLMPCPKCAKQLGPAGFRQHVTTCDPEKAKFRISAPKKCLNQECGLEFKRANQLYQHLKEVHDDAMPCEICERKIKIMAYVPHLKTCRTAGEMKYRCLYDGCVIFFACEDDLMCHRDRVHTEAVICRHEDCKWYGKSELLDWHLKSVHQTNCKRTSKTEIIAESQELLEGMEIKVQKCDSEFKCPFNDCSKYFPTVEDVIFHLADSHKPQHGSLFVAAVAVAKLLSNEYNCVTENKVTRMPGGSPKFGICDHCGKKMSYKKLVPHFEKCNEELNNKCPIDGCPRSYAKAGSLKAHVKNVHHSSKKTCTFCHRQFAYATFHKHVERCITKNQVENEQLCSVQVTRNCLLCPERPEINAADFADHYKEYHDTTIRTGKKCGKSVKKNVKYHLEQCSNKGNKNFPCPQEGCGRFFISAYFVRQHVGLCHQEPLKCPYDGCDKYFAPSVMKPHIRRAHEKRKEICDTCGDEVDSLNFRKHVRLCTADGQKGFECPHEGCGQSFAIKEYLSVHVRRVHQKLVKCPHCEKLLKPVSLAPHIRVVHDNIKPTEMCDFCGKEVLVKNKKRHFTICLKNRTESSK